MEKNFGLALALSMLVIIGFYILFPPPTPPPPSPELTSTEATTAAPINSAPASTELPQTTGKLLTTQQPPIVVKTPLYEARFSAQGGVLTSFKLNKYLQNKQHVSWGELIPALSSISFLAPPVDEKYGARVSMLDDVSANGYPYLVNFVERPDLTSFFSESAYNVSTDQLVIDQASEVGAIEFSLKHPEGIEVIKRIAFNADEYLLRYTVIINNYSEASLSLRQQNLLGEGPPFTDASSSHFQGAVYGEEDSIETESLEDLAPRLILRNADWLGITNNYFISAHRSITPATYAFYNIDQLPTNWNGVIGFEYPALALQSGSSYSSEVLSYLGPKSQTDMATFGSNLEDSPDLTLSFLSVPLLKLLRWFFSWTGNYGIAIILLTITVRGVLFPLTYKGMVSMKRMSKLQPKVKALREKYGDNREAMNREMMALYKKAKVNPLGGCFPILLQLPVFIALYSALLGAIELRHAPFTLWLNDLSAMDPLFITPLLMGISMFAQQKLTPTALDSTQQKIMMLMPLIFSAFMFTFPSGLVLYWLVSNLLSILQQFVINRVQVADPLPVDEPISTNKKSDNKPARKAAAKPLLTNKKSANNSASKKRTTRKNQKG